MTGESIDQDFFDYYNCSDCCGGMDDVLNLGEQDDIWRDLVYGTGYFSEGGDSVDSVDEAFSTIVESAVGILDAIDDYMGYDDYYY